MQDFELLVIGDGCSDDSAEVVASFKDARIRWENLPKNTGSQSAPNNRGLELAAAPHVAYLGHDDVWYPEHLDVLLKNIGDRDAAYSLAALIGPPPQNIHSLTGLSPSGTYEYNQFVPPSSVLHKQNLAADIGGWKNYRTIRTQPDVDFLTRALDFGKRFAPVQELTVFKFPSNLRKNSYKDKRSDEQAECVKRIESEPDYRYRVLLENLSQPGRSISADDAVRSKACRRREATGSVVEEWRACSRIAAAGMRYYSGCMSFRARAKQFRASSN